MKYENWTPPAYPDDDEDDRRRSFHTSMFRTLSGSAALTCSIVLAAWFLYARLDDANPPKQPVVANNAATLPGAHYEASLGVLVPVVAANTYGDLVYPTYSLHNNSVSFAQSSPLSTGFQSNESPVRVANLEADKVIAVPVPGAAAPQVLQNVPLPAPRPSDLFAGYTSSRPQGHQMAQARAAVEPPAPTSEGPSFFQKLFGMPSSSGQVLAYAAPEDGALRSSPIPAPSSKPALPNDRLTAVYDISKRTVYLPNGTKLEAHSGLGEMLDDPRFVNERMRGATPPHVYELTYREALFHGVQALRLTPIGEGTVYGRSGLLAHRYMLGPNGDSNGCVSIKDYDAFLQAFKNGEFKRLLVVARMN